MNITISESDKAKKGVNFEKTIETRFSESLKEYAIAALDALVEIPTDCIYSALLYFIYKMENRGLRGEHFMWLATAALDAAIECEGVDRIRLNGIGTEARNLLETQEAIAKVTGNRPTLLTKYPDVVAPERTESLFAKNGYTDAEFQDNPEDRPVTTVIYGSPSEFKPQPYLIKDMIPQEGLGVVYGPPGSYKTFATIDLAIHLAIGREFSGRRIKKKAVCYIAGEGLGSFNMRTLAWQMLNIKDKGSAEYQDLQRNFFVIPRAMNISLKVNSEISEIIKIIKKHNAEAESNGAEPVGMIVIDTLSRCFDGDENSTRDMQEFSKACNEIIKATGVTILVIHHCGKNGALGGRGSSVLLGDCDFEFSIMKSANLQYDLICTKQKHYADIDSVTYKLEIQELGDDEDGDKISTLVRNASISPKKRKPVPQTPELRAVFELCKKHSIHGMVDFKGAKAEYCDMESANENDPETRRKKRNSAGMSFNRHTDSLKKNGDLLETKDGILCQN